MPRIERTTTMPPIQEENDELIFRVGKSTVVAPRQPPYTTKLIARVVGQTEKYVGSVIAAMKNEDPTIEPDFIPNPNRGRAIQSFSETDFKKLVTILLERKNNERKRGRTKRESFPLSDLINAVNPTEIEEKVLQIIADAQNNRERKSVEDIRKTLMADGVDSSQIERSNLSTIIRAIQSKLGNTDYELVGRSSKKPKRTYYILRKRTLQKHDSKIESAMTETLPDPEAEKAKKLMAAKAALEILSMIEANYTRPNVRIILGHHLPHKDTIPAIFGSDVTDEELKKFIIESFTFWWNRDPKAVKDASDEESTIAEKCQQLRTQGKSIKGLIGDLSRTLGVKLTPANPLFG